MDLDQSIGLMKALADRSRVRVLQNLLEGPRYVEELAERLALSPSTVSFHLKKLEQVGLVRGRKEQYYVVYSADDAILETPLRRLVEASAPDRSAEPRRLADYHDKVLATFFQDGRLTRLPAQHKKRRLVLEAFSRDLVPGRIYTEPEMNGLIHARFDDHCLVRREMIDLGLVAREGQRYRSLAPAGGESRPLPPPTPPAPATATPADLPAAPTAASRGGDQMDKATRRELTRSYKAAEKVAGIYVVRNKETGRVLLGSSLNLHGPLNKHQLQLRIGSHRCEGLQRDWNALGPDAFEFEIVDKVEIDSSKPLDVKTALEALEEKWLAKLQPLESHCYNTNARIRTTPF